MSYMNTPRLNFAGQFFANPGTINNVLSNYDPRNPINPVWNPNGVALWRFQDVTMQSVINDSGDILVAGEAGGIGQAVLESVPDPTAAKLVDLDPEQQFISQVFGLKVKFSLTNDSGDEIGFAGRLETSSLTDIWFGRPGGVSGSFQTLLPGSQIEWIGDVEQIDVLKQLKERGSAGLSFKWMTYGYTFTPTFLGKVVGSIGPAVCGEPVRLVAGRRLHPPTPNKETGQPQFWPVPWIVDEDRRRAVFDLSNSVPLNSSGTLTASITTNSCPVVLDQPLRYSMDRLQKTAGIAEVPLNDNQLGLLRDHSLSVSVEGSSDSVLEEDTEGRWASFDQSWLRVEAGGQKTVRLYARQFNGPLKCEKLRLDLTQMRHPLSGLTVNGQALPRDIQTDEDGQVEVEFNGHSLNSTTDPMPEPRTFLDSQVYFVGGPWQQWGGLFQAAGGGAISVLVFNEFTSPRNPTWQSDVQPIFDEYARLYPGMKNIRDLSSHSVVTSHLGQFERVLNPAMPITDPDYMPVTRDLSPKKREMIYHWLQAGAP